MAESKIVSAVGVAAGMHVAGQEKSDLNKALEKAMSDAVTQAHAGWLERSRSDQTSNSEGQRQGIGRAL
jgi:hypothetical protein